MEAQRLIDVEAPRLIVEAPRLIDSPSREISLAPATRFPHDKSLCTHSVAGLSSTHATYLGPPSSRGCAPPPSAQAWYQYLSPSFSPSLPLSLHPQLIPLSPTPLSLPLVLVVHPLQAYLSPLSRPLLSLPLSRPLIHTAYPLLYLPGVQSLPLHIGRSQVSVSTKERKQASCLRVTDAIHRSVKLRRYGRDSWGHQLVPGQHVYSCGGALCCG